MPRPSSSKDGGGGGIFGSIRPGSRRSSKVPSEDGHGGVVGGPNVLRSPSLSAQSSDHHHHSSRALDRHTRMKLAMAEAQADLLGGAGAQAAPPNAAASANGRIDDGGGGDLHAHTRDTRDTHTPSGAVSPRTNIAAGQAQAQAAAAVAAAQRMGGSVGGDVASPARPGEGSLTFEAFGGASGGDVVLADGVTPPSAGAAVASDAPQFAPDPHVTDSPTAVRQDSLPPDDGGGAHPQTHTRYATTGAPQGGLDPHAHARSRTDHAHTMAQSASTSALTPGPFSRLRKLSDASSHAAGALSADGGGAAPAPRKASKGAGGGGGIAAALAASGAGMAGLGAANPAALQEAHAKAAAAAAAAAANPQTRKTSHGQRVEKDFVGGSQGGVYRDPRSGLLVEKNEAGEEKLVHARGDAGDAGRAQSQPDPDSAPPPPTQPPHGSDPAMLAALRHHPSTSSLAESDASSASGLAAAASFPAAMQAGSLLTPALSHTANAPGAPTIALDASHAEHHYPSPRTSLDTKGGGGGGGEVAPTAAGTQDATTAGGGDPLDAVRRHSADALISDSASTAGAGWADMGAQITGFAVASSKRNAEFHALFPNVPDDDYLIEDYGCALVREVFIQGRLYVSENHVCFNANIFGWVTNIVVPFSEIVAIEKRMTALIIPNAIQIATLHVKHTFSSFLGRDTTYDLMANIWKLSHPDVPLNAVEAAAGASDGEESGGEDLDGASHDASASTTTPSKVSKRARLRKKLKGVTGSKDEWGQGGAKVNGTGGAGVVVANGKTTAAAAVPEAGATPAPAASAPAPAKKVIHPATSCPCESTKDKKHYATTVMDAKYPAVPAKMYDLMFKGDFMRDFWTDNQKLLELEISPWKTPGSADGAVAATRDMSYIKPLSGSIGPKQTKCLITDEAQHLDAEVYLTAVTTTRTPDVPSGGSFSVKTRVCITWAGGGNFSHVLVTCATEWTGRSMLKGVIDKASIDGQRVYYRDLEEAMRKHIAQNPALFKEEGDDDEGGEEEAEVAAEVAGAAAAAAGAVAAATPGGEKAGGAGTIAKDTSSANAASSGGTGTSLLDTALDFFSTLLDALTSLTSTLTSSPSSAALAALVALLLLSNIWALSSSGAARGQARDPLDPHRLRGGGGGSSAAAAPKATTATRGTADAAQGSENAVAEAVRDVLRDYLEPLSASLAALSLPQQQQQAQHGYAHAHGHAHARRDATPHPHSQGDVQSVEAAREEVAFLKQAMAELEARMGVLRRGLEVLERGAGGGGGGEGRVLEGGEGKEGENRALP